MLANSKRVYQVGTFTAERRKNGWYFWRSYGDKDDKKGPYANPTSVSLMIARALKRELVKRDAPYNVET